MKAIHLWLNLMIMAGNDVNIENGLLLVAKFLTAAAFHSHHRFFFAETNTLMQLSLELGCSMLHFFFMFSVGGGY